MSKAPIGPGVIPAPLLTGSRQGPNILQRIWRTYKRATERPGSRPRRYWNGLIFLFLIYNWFAIFFLLAFPQNDDYWAWYGIFYAGDSLMILDMIVWFTSPYMSTEGQVITEPKAIAMHYLKGMFVVDFIASFQWDVFYTGDRQIHALLRLPTLLRWVRVGQYFAAWEHNSAFSNLARMIKLLLGVFMITHVIGCLYYVVSLYNGGNDWVTSTDSTLVLYWRCFFWAFVTMTGTWPPGFPEISLELMFTLITTVVGVLIFAVVIGMVGQLIMNMGERTNAFRSKMDMINNFMRRNDVPEAIQTRVHNYYENLWLRHQGDDDRALIGMLPPHLRKELSMFLHEDLLHKVPIFESVREPGFLNILVLALHPEMYAPGDTIMRAGDVGTEMYFIARGSVQVELNDGTVVATLHEGNFFGEIALLFKGKRTATVKAVTYVDVFVLHKETVDRALSDYPEYIDIIFDVAEHRLNMDNNVERRKHLNEAKKALRDGAAAMKEDTDRSEEMRLMRNGSKASMARSSSGHMAAVVESRSAIQKHLMQARLRRNTRAPDQLAAELAAVNACQDPVSDGETETGSAAPPTLPDEQGDETIADDEPLSADALEGEGAGTGDSEPEAPTPKGAASDSVPVLPSPPTSAPPSRNPSISFLPQINDSPKIRRPTAPSAPASREAFASDDKPPQSPPPLPRVRHVPPLKISDRAASMTALSVDRDGDVVDAVSDVMAAAAQLDITLTQRQTLLARASRRDLAEMHTLLSKSMARIVDFLSHNGRS